MRFIGGLQFLQECTCICEATAVLPEPFGWGSWVDPEPISILAVFASMLRFCMFERDMFRNDPAMSIERRKPKADDVFVVLIADLLEYIKTAFPKHGKFDFDTPSSNDQVSLWVSAGGNREPFGSTPSRYKLFANLAYLPGWARTNPPEWAANPRIVGFLGEILLYQATCNGSEYLDIRVLNGSTHFPAFC